MYALAEPPRSVPRALRVVDTRRGDPPRPRRARPEVYRRRRLAVAAAFVAVVAVAVGVATGAADESIAERFAALIVLAGWVVAAVSLSRWERRTGPCGAAPRASCLALEAAPDTA